MAVAGLHNSASGFGIQATWPAGFPLFSIPIDHVLLSDNLRVAFFEVGEGVGSDHYLLYVGLGFINSLPPDWNETD